MNPIDDTNYYVPSASRDFFNSIYNRFQSAEQQAGSIEYYINIAGHTVKMIFAGPAMTAHYLPALEHLIVAPAVDPEFTICTWDSTSTGTPLPQQVSDLLSYCIYSQEIALSPRNEINSIKNDQLFTYFLAGPKILNVMDSSQNIAIYWLNDADKTPFYEKSNPYKPILNWFMQSTDLIMMHAAGVGNPEGGVLITGKSESGKSSSALSCLNSELLFLSDDTCVGSFNAVQMAYSLFNSGRLNGEEDLEKLPHLKAGVSNPVREEGEKLLFYIHQYQPDKIIKSFPIKAILIPRLTFEYDTKITTASPKEALLSLAPSSILQLPGAGSRNFEKIAELVRLVPSFHLELGSTRIQIPGVIEGLLRDI